jgi:hypothetical protein
MPADAPEGMGVAPGAVVGCWQTRKRTLEMYQKPRLVRFGTFRELTLFGLSGPDCDGGSIYGMGGNWRGCDLAPIIENAPEGGGS